MDESTEEHGTGLNGSARLKVEQDRPPLSASGTVRLQRGEKPGTDNPEKPAFTLRAWTKRAMLDYQHAVRSEVAYVAPDEIARALRIAVTHLLQPDEAQLALANLDRWDKVPKHENTDAPILPELPVFSPDQARAVVDAVADGDMEKAAELTQPKAKRRRRKAEDDTDSAPTLTADEQAQLDAAKAERDELFALWGEISALKRIAHRGSANYRALIADADRWWNLTMYLAVKYSLVGWERVNGHDGKPAKLERRDNVVTDASLSLIADDDFNFLALKAISLQRPNAEFRKN